MARHRHELRRRGARRRPASRIGFLPQEPQLDPDQGRAQHRDGRRRRDLRARSQRFNEISDKFAEPMDDERDEQAARGAGASCRMPSTPPAAGSWSASSRSPPTRCACRPGRRRSASSRAARSAAWRCAGCCCPQPDMLLLDEPTNHLDAESVAWLERYLEEYPSTVIAVTHDRYFLDNVAEWILELDRGHGIPWQGNYSSWLEQKEQRLALEEREQRGAAQDAGARARMGAPNPKARQAKSKARLQRYEELASREFQERNETNEIYIPPGERLGDLVIEVEEPAQGLRRPAADRQPLLQPAARRHRRHHRPERRRQDHAVPHAHRRGEARRAARSASARRVKLAYVDQSRQTLDDKKTVWQEISGGLDMIKVGNYETPSRGYVGRFNFKGTQQQQLIGELSGGERNRVHLAKVLQVRRQRAAARRAHQRSRRRDAARARGGAAELSRLRGGHLARSLVPRSHRHPHPRVRGRLARWSGSRATTRTTSRTASAARATMPRSRIASSTSR